MRHALALYQSYDAPAVIALHHHKHHIEQGGQHRGNDEYQISAEALRAKAESEPDSYDAENGYRDIHGKETWFAPAVRYALTECTKNADGSYTMEVYLLAADPQTGEAAEYCNTPMLVTVDLSGGHPVFLSARAKDLLSEQA